MSYCRFSSDDFQCDVYVYADVMGGYTTHIATNRVIGDIPHIPDMLVTPVDEWIAAHSKQCEFLKTAKRAPIGLKYDGMTFNDSTANNCADRLEKIRKAGYNVPQYAIDGLREEDE